MKVESENEDSPPTAMKKEKDADMNDKIKELNTAEISTVTNKCPMEIDTMEHKTHSSVINKKQNGKKRRIRDESLPSKTANEKPLGKSRSKRQKRIRQKNPRNDNFVTSRKV